ncbi:MAG: hypothetical protein RL154_401 [Pseudomonadota bacterium]
MQVYADKVEASIQGLKKVSEIDTNYAEDPRYDIALYDDKLKLLYGTFNAKVEWSINFYTKDEYIYFIDKIETKFLKAHYVVIRGQNLDEILDDVRSKLYMTISVAFLFIILMAYFLAKAFLKPLRDAIAKMDEFIKDTTHELNTPLSAILMSIETINMNKIDESTKKKLGRIVVASRTISSLYQALSFSILQEKLKTKNELFDVKDLILERIDYFEPIASVKNVLIESTVNSMIFSIDKLKMQIVIDNLLSNAIKYNKKGGKVFVELNFEYLSVRDEGIGIGTQKIDDIFARYARFDSATGGFGLGLSIVKSICDEYKIKIVVESQTDEGTTFRLEWPPKIS